MPEVKAVMPFYDMAGKTSRQVGDVWSCDKERAKTLAAYGFVETSAAPKEEPAVAEEPEVAEEVVEEQPKPKRTSKKKAE